MRLDPVAEDFFRTQVQDPANAKCCDCGTDGASWASISHGIYLSIGAAGLHRSLGVKVSFVQSTTMDSWRPIHLKMMELGGNRRFNEFLRSQGIPEDMPIREKYSTQAAKWYRENLKAEAEGSETPAPLPPGTGHLLISDSANSAQRVLDQVFAKAHCSGSITSSGVQSAQTHHGLMTRGPTQKTSFTGYRGLWDALGATMEKTWRHSASATAALGCPNGLEVGQLGGIVAGRYVVKPPKSSERTRRRTLSPTSAQRRRRLAADLSLEWLLTPVPLPTLLASSKTHCPTAERLQRLSSGKMPGFGCDDCHATPLAVARASEGDPSTAAAAA